MSQQPFLRLLHGRTPQLRTFTRASAFFQRVPVKPSIKKPTSNLGPKPQGQSVASKVATNTSTELNAKPLPLKDYTQHSGPPSRALQLLGDLERLTLYKAPKHNAFAISSYFCGAALVSYGVMHGNFVLNGSSGWLTLLLAVACTSSALLGCGLFMAPMKLIKSVSVVRTSEGLARLRFEGRSRIPFRKAKAFEVDPKEVAADRNVPMSLSTWHSVSFKQAEQWSETNQPFSTPILDPVSRWFSYVRRMFNRDGMVNVRIGGQGLWKVDLNECEILEGGSPLMSVVQQDPEVRQGVVYKLVKGVGTGRK